MEFGIGNGFDRPMIYMVWVFAYDFRFTWNWIFWEERILGFYDVILFVFLEWIIGFKEVIFSYLIARETEHLELREFSCSELVEHFGEIE